MVAAHRGVAAGAVENTIAAFTNAIDVGADMIEFDVRRTRDGALIAFHDPAVGGVPVGALTRDEIAAAAGVKPPLLTEVLRTCAGRIQLDVELKEDGYVPEVTAVLRDGFDPDQMVVTSFLPAVVAQAKDAFPALRTGLLVGSGGPWTDLPARLRELYPVALARSVRADYLAPHYRLAALGVVRRAAAAGLPCLLWTVNSPALIRRYAADERIAAIITDVAAQAVSIVGGAGRLGRRRRRSREHLLDRLPGYAELAGDVRLRETLADQLPGDVAADSVCLPGLHCVLDRLRAGLAEAVEGFLVVVRLQCHAASVTTMGCHCQLGVVT
jgi:glycerophosphoryl diester phosphodiesterase